MDCTLAAGMPNHHCFELACSMSTAKLHSKTGAAGGTWQKYTGFASTLQCAVQLKVTQAQGYHVIFHEGVTSSDVLWPWLLRYGKRAMGSTVPADLLRQRCTPFQSPAQRHGRQLAPPSAAGVAPAAGPHSSGRPSMQQMSSAPCCPVSAPRPS